MLREHGETVAELIALDTAGGKTLKQLIKQKEKEMNDAVKVLDFETAAILRDEVLALEQLSAKKVDTKKSDKKRGGRTS